MAETITASITASQLADIFKYIFCTPFGGKNDGGMFVIHKDFFYSMRSFFVDKVPVEERPEDYYQNIKFPPNAQFMVDLIESLRELGLSITTLMGDYYLVICLDLYPYEVREVPKHVLDRFFSTIGPVTEPC